MLRLEDLHLEFLHLRCDAVLGGVAEDQAFFYSAVQGIVKHQVQAADGGAAESRIAVTAFTSGAAALHQLLVELLQVVGGQLGELDAADAGDGIHANNCIANIGLNSIKKLPFSINFVHCLNNWQESVYNIWASDTALVKST